MSEMINISKLKTWDKLHKVFIQSKYGVFVERADLEKLLETAHNSDYAKCLACAEDITTDYDININPELIAKTIGRHFA